MIVLFQGLSVLFSGWIVSKGISYLECWLRKQCVTFLLSCVLKTKSLKENVLCIMYMVIEVLFWSQVGKLEMARRDTGYFVVLIKKQRKRNYRQTQKGVGALVPTRLPVYIDYNTVLPMWLFVIISFITCVLQSAYRTHKRAREAIPAHFPTYLPYQLGIHPGFRNVGKNL